jgi:hypothetical protein
MPTAEAIQWVDVATPNVPRISGRVVNFILASWVQEWAGSGVARITQRAQAVSENFRTERPEHLPIAMAVPSARQGTPIEWHGCVQFQPRPLWRAAQHPGQARR